MTRILVINPPCRDKTINRDMAGGLGYSAGEGVVLPPIDLLNVATTLIKRRYKVWFTDSVAERIDDWETVGEIVEKEKIEVIISGLALPTIWEDCAFAKKIKGKFSKLRFIFKTGINYKQVLEEALRRSGAERIIFGECDLNIVEYLKNKKTDASVYWQGRKIVYRPLTPKDRIENMDKLPVTARELGKINLYKYGLLPGRTTTVQTSRGCPYPCEYYCPYPLVQGRNWRAMGTARMIREVKSIKVLGIKNILFRDATFTLDMERTKKFCQQILDGKIKINWWCETRINVLSVDLLKIMKEAGCQGINVGVETLDQKLIVDQGKPGVTVENVKKIREAAKKIGIKLHFLMIIGLPNENLRTINNTFEYLVKLSPESVGFSTITPYPGTKMFDMARKEGLIKGFDWSRFNGSEENMATKYLTKTDMVILRWILSATSFGIKRGGVSKEIIVKFNRIILNWWRIWRRE